MTDPKINHRLMKILMGMSDVTEDEMLELYGDLQGVYDNPMDALIDDAMVNRGCVYIEVMNQLPN